MSNLNNCILKLPLSKNPPIIGYQYHAYYLGIAFCDNDNCLPWFLNRYVQLYFDYKKLDFTFKLKHNHEELFYYEKIKKETIMDDNIALNDLIVGMINKKYYIRTCIDEYYIPNRAAYNKNNFTHDILVFGYDIRNEQYNVIGFTDKKTYEETTVSFNEFHNAYMANSVRDYLLFIHNAYDKVYYIDINMICRDLSCYLDSCNVPGNKLDENYLFGIEACKELLKFLEQLYSINKPIDYRSFHILWEHKKCMLMRIRYLKENSFIENSDDLYDKYMSIVKKALIIRNLCLKYNISLKKSILTKTAALLDDMIRQEQRLLSKLLDKLNL